MRAYSKMVLRTLRMGKVRVRFPVGPKRRFYPVRKYPLACQRVIPNFTNTGVNTPCEFSNGIYFSRAAKCAMINI